MRFADRSDAGRRLAEQLTTLNLDRPLILGLPRGGVPVAFEVAHAWQAELDVLVARKLGAPFQPELGVGAIAEGGVIVLEDATLSSLGLSRDDMAPTIEREEAELERRVALYRDGRQRIEPAGRTVVVIDDGLATGVTARAALRSVRQSQPQRLILAVPVGPPDAQSIMAGEADDILCVEQPARLAAVGQWYSDFTQTDDATVIELLQRAAAAEG